MHEGRQRQRRDVRAVAPRSGDAQVDFGEALAVIGGVEPKITSWRWTCRTATAAGAGLSVGEQRSLLRRAQRRFEFFGGVPCSILYDNTKLAVARILGDGRRLRTKVFGELQSHYLFADRFGRPDKGKVEGLVGYARRNFMVPNPRAESFAALNARLLEHCRRRWGGRLRGHAETIGERLVRDQAALLPLPATPYEACEKEAARASSLSLVRYRGNRYLSGISCAPWLISLSLILAFLGGHFRRVRLVHTAIKGTSLEKGRYPKSAPPSPHPPFRLTVSTLARRGLYDRRTRSLTPVPPGGVRSDSIARSVPVRTRIREWQFPVTGSGFPVLISREFSQKA